MKWKKRSYQRDDQDGVVSLWLRSYSESEYGIQRKANAAHSPERDLFWLEQGKTTMALIGAFGVEVICDAQAEDVILAFACKANGVVHFAVSKKQFGIELGRQWLYELLGPELAGGAILTHEIRCLARCGIRPPPTWRLDSRAILPAIMGVYSA